MEFRPKKVKSAKEKASILPRTNVAESLEQSKKDKKDNKRRFWKHKRDHTGEQKEETLAIGTNITDARSKKKYPNITYYNCDKKGYYSKSCPEPSKNQSQS